MTSIVDDDATLTKPAKRNTRKQPAKPAAAPKPVLSPVTVITQTKQTLSEITGLVAETVSRFKANGDGFSLSIELVEMKTFQGSSDVLATYEVELDANGSLLDYQRVRRYSRNELDG